MTDSKSRCVDEISTDTRPIVYFTIDRLSTDYRPTIDRLSTDYRRTIDRLSTDHRPTIDRLSTNYRPTIDRLSTYCRPLYRLLCRPISQSTLPTVNKIQKIYLNKKIMFSKCDKIMHNSWIIFPNSLCLRVQYFTHSSVSHTQLAIIIVVLSEGK